MKLSTTALYAEWLWTGEAIMLYSVSVGGTAPSVTMLFVTSVTKRRRKLLFVQSARKPTCFLSVQWQTACHRSTVVDDLRTFGFQEVPAARVKRLTLLSPQVCSQSSSTLLLRHPALCSNVIMI